ncbi:MAG: hypothetical protein LOD91_03695 [Limnochordales bacterium]|nr:hypothetical protein [Limnochordales bacterium]
MRPVRSQAGRAAALALAVAMLAGGCGSPFPRLETPATGRMAVTASLPAAAALSPLQEFEVSLTQGRHVVQKRGPVEGETFAVTLDNLYIGQWEVAVSVWDAEGDAIYTGSGSVWISENETTTVHVPLVPRPGELALTIDISGLPLEEQSYKARLHVSPGGVHNLDRVPGTALFEARVSLEPGSYDFKVDFYSDTFHAHKLLHTGYWMPVSIRPGKTAALYWKPGTGAVEIEAEPAGPPPAPAQLVAAWQEGAVVVEWTPVPAAGIVAYRVYRRLGPLDRYELLTEVDAGTRQVVDTPPPADGMPPAGPGVYYVVTAVNEAGYESLRSPEAAVFIPAIPAGLRG